MKGPNLCLVIDADIARMAGPDPKAHPWPAGAKLSHDILAELRKMKGYHFAFDRTLLAEWKKHQGRTASRWLADMLAAGRINRVHKIESEWLDTLIKALPEPDQAVAFKDKHLILLAHAPGDDRILSGDEKAREKFARLRDERLDPMLWIGPTQGCKRWIRDGAPIVGEWQLGFRAPAK